MWTGLGQGNRLATSQAACAGGAETIGRGSASDWSTETVACSTLSAVALTNWFAAFSAVRVAARAFLAVLRMADFAPRLTDFTCRRVERAALRTLRFTLRTADLAFTRAETLRALALRRTAVVLRATFRRTTLFLRATLRRTERRAALFGFFLAAMTVLQKCSTPMRASLVATPRLHARLATGDCQRQKEGKLVERKGIEPSTFALRTRRSPS